MSEKDLVLDEPIATGWAHKQFLGDEEVAKGHMTVARSMIGALKSRYGVNERIAAGEPGGYYFHQQQLPDGTLIEVFTNDGHDSMRITSPGSSIVSSEVSSQESSAETSEGSEPTKSSHQSTDEATEIAIRVTGYHPYLWVGARIVSGGLGFSGEFINKLHLCVWEQQGDGEPDIILSNRNHLIGFDGDKAKYPLQPVEMQIPSNRDPRGFGYLESGLVQISRDQPDGYSIPMICPLDNPDDPETVTWDEMVIGDPDNDLELLKPDGTQLVANPQGNHLVKVMVVGPECGPQVPCEVELRVICGKYQGFDDDLQFDDSIRFTISEFTYYKMGILPFGWFDPLPDPDDDTCHTCSSRAPDHGANPHAPHWWQGAASAFVAPLQVSTPREQLAIGTVSFSKPGEVSLPDDGFEPGPWHPYADLCPACEATVTYYASFGYGVQQGTVTTGGNCSIPGEDAVERTEHAEFSVSITEFNVSDDPLFSDYGLSTGTTAQASNGNDPASFSVGITIGSPQTIIYHRSDEVVVNLADGAGCIMGVWFPGTPTGATDPPFNWNDFSGVHVTGFSATYKYSRRIDQHGRVIPDTKTASWVSLSEYLSVVLKKNDDGTLKYHQVQDFLDENGDPAPGGGTLVVTCTRVVQDD